MVKFSRQENIDQLKVLQSFGSKESKHAINQVVDIYTRGVIKTKNQAGLMINIIISGRGAAKTQTSEYKTQFYNETILKQITRELLLNQLRNYKRIKYLVKLMLRRLIRK